MVKHRDSSSLDAADIHRKFEQLVLNRFDFPWRDSPNPIVFLTRTSGLILDCNVAFEQLTGFPRKDLIGQTASALALQTIPADQNHRRGKVDEPDAAMATEIQLRTRDRGEIRIPAALRILNQRWINGERILVYFARDLTPAFAGRTALMQQPGARDELPRLAFDHAVMAMALVDPAGKLLRVNKAFTRLVGYSEEELAHLTFVELTHPDDLFDDLELSADLFRGEIEDFNLEKRYICKTGETIRVRLHVALVRDAENSPLFAVSQIEDITERKLAEARQRQSESRYLDLIDRAPAVFYSRSRGPNGPVAYISSNADTLLGAGVRDAYLAGQSLVHIHPEDRARVRADAMLALTTETPFSGEYRVLRPDGSITWVRDEFVLAGDEDGTDKTWQGVIVDITRERELRERAEEAFGAAQSSNRTKSVFLSTMSHELRTPLNAIMGYSNLLLDGQVGSLTAAQTEVLRHVTSGAERLLHLINDVLDLTRIEAGGIELNPELIDLGALLQSVRIEVLPLVSDRDICFEIQVADDLPSAPGDPLRIRQVLLNLIGNAIKFTEHGTIHARATADREWARIAVTDTGIGISEESLTEIFEEFRQVDRDANRRYGGTGLGLSIARRIARLHGGDIEVTSQPGRGSTFTLKLPIASPETMTTARPGDASGSASAS